MFTRQVGRYLVQAKIVKSSCEEHKETQKLVSDQRLCNCSCLLNAGLWAAQVPKDTAVKYISSRKYHKSWYSIEESMEQKEKTAQNHMRSSSSLDLPSPAATYSIRTEEKGVDVDITAHRNSQVSLTRSYTFGLTGLLTKLFKHNILFLIIYKSLEQVSNLFYYSNQTSQK